MRRTKFSPKRQSERRAREIQEEISTRLQAHHKAKKEARKSQKWPWEEYRDEMASRCPTCLRPLTRHAFDNNGNEITIIIPED